MTKSLRGLRALLVPVAVVAFTACVDDNVVYVDRFDFDDPPAGAQGFVGYSNLEAGRTVCGNCHVGRQARWEETAHADAWATLANSGSSQAFCEACHTVSERGNPAEGEAGWVATLNPRYRDVQCESCHGPGLDHVTTPDAPGNQPLATMSLGPGVDRGCAECHSGVHRPFAEEWASSAHGSMNPSPQGNANCQSCHEGKGALRAWGVKSVFAPGDQGQNLAITCAVCHDPHDATHRGQLRFAIDVPNVEQNLCMKCHNQRGEPDFATFRAPHAPEGPLLLGTGGWWPPNLEYSQGDILGTHGTESNPRLCAGCHVTDRQMEDPETGAFAFRTTGHTFQAIPCVDGDGIPTGETDCSLMERSFVSCTDGCHSEQGARSALIEARDRIGDLADDLQAMLDQLDPSEFGNPGVYTTADGSLFNLRLARVPGSEVHNPFLVAALLRASMRQIETDYGISASASAFPEHLFPSP